MTKFDFQKYVIDELKSLHVKMDNALEKISCHGERLAKVEVKAWVGSGIVSILLSGLVAWLAR